MEPRPAPEEGSFQADIIDFREAQAKKLSENAGVDNPRERLDALAREHNLPRAADGIHISTEVLTDSTGARIDTEVLREIMSAEEAYDDAASQPTSSGDGPLPPAIGH